MWRKVVVVDVTKEVQMGRFQNPWGKGGENYPNDILDTEKVLGNDIYQNINAYENFPSFSTLLSNYPSFGSNQSAHPCDIPDYYNQCSIRVSTAFFLSGHSFEKVSKNHKVDFCNKHGFKHVRSAKTLATNLVIKKYGYGKFVEYTPKTFKSKFKIDLNQSNFDIHFGSKTGLIYQNWGNQNVHIDLYNKGTSGSGNYIDYVGESIENDAKIIFWEIK